MDRSRVLEERLGGGQTETDDITMRRLPEGLGGGLQATSRGGLGGAVALFEDNEALGFLGERGRPRRLCDERLHRLARPQCHRPPQGK